jgi:hypothetical protein
LPYFSLAGGFYDKSQYLTIKAHSPAALIRYTLDGATPTSDSPVYTTPIRLDSTTVVRASAVQAGYLPSPAVNQTYFIDESVMLPVMSVMTAPQNLWDSQMGIYVNENVLLRKEWERPVHIQFFEDDGSLGFSTDASIRLFGRSAMQLPQKSLAVFIQNANGTDTLHYRLFPEEQLRSSSDDWPQTLFRDAMAHQVLREHFSLDTQLYRPSILFLNGEYFGIHNIREKYNEHHIAAKHGIDPFDIDLLSIHIDYRSGKKTIEVLQGESDGYEALLDYVTGHDMRIVDNYAYVQTQIDLDNYIDYIISEIYVGNTSWPRNRKVWRDRASPGKWTFMIYDLDRGFDDPQVDLLQKLADQDLLFSALLENAEFKGEFIRRFCNHLNSSFEPAGVVDIIDRLRAGIEPEMPRHIDRWKDHCDPVCGIPSLDTWEDEIDKVRAFARQRPVYVRQHLVEKFGSSGTAQLTLKISEPDGGRVLINDMAVTESHFTYIYLTDIPLRLMATPNAGYRFLGWLETKENANLTTVILTQDLVLTAIFAPIERPNAAYGNGILAALLALSVFVGLLTLVHRRWANDNFVRRDQ